MTELKAMLKDNKIRGYLHYNKPELPETIKITTITLLSERENTNKTNRKYNFLKHIRNSPKKVEIQGMKTVEIIIYSSMYKAAKRFNQQSRLISTYDGKVWRNRYAMKVLTESN